MIPEREREALMRLTMCAREECSMCKYKDTCNFDFQYETATRCMNILAEALRKTENSSEKPNNCETCKYHDKYGCEHPCDECEGCDKWEQTEPTISKMEQVDKDINVRSKDEPQTEVDWKQRLCDMYGADRKSFDEAWRKYEADKVKDEPQTERSE